MFDMDYWRPPMDVAHPPFGSGDDPAADFVLQTSNGVRLWLSKDVVSRASPVFHDVFGIPHPPAAPDAAPDGPDSDWVDGKPVVRVTEDADTIDIFLRCCYPLKRPDIRPSQLTAVCEAGEKYDADAVRGYARKELARYALKTEHCVRAYLIAYRFKWHEEIWAASQQSINVPRHGLLAPELPEHRTVLAMALTRLQDYRKRCLEAVASFFTPQSCVQHFNDTRQPMWEYCEDVEDILDTGCTCSFVNYLYTTEKPGDYGTDLDKQFAVKEWFAEYLEKLRKAIQRDDTTIRRALLDPEAMASVTREVDACAVCRTNVSGALAAFLRDVEGEIDTIVSKVPGVQYYP